MGWSLHLAWPAGDRCGRRWDPDMLRQPGQALRRDIGVHDDQLGVLQQVLTALQKGGSHMLVDFHVGYRQCHIPLLVGQEQVGGGGRAGHLEALGDVDAQLSAGGGDLLGVQVVAEGGDHPHVQAQKAHVVGDVPAHAAQTHPHAPGLESRSTGTSDGQPPMSMLTPPTTVT